ncbi:hypothetical protein HZC00_01860 [Candidatus Kaiserbacteria bacterium]|nr:hypothetical protein [Candidatus Kaiserbacteria bacterium]
MSLDDMEWRKKNEGLSGFEPINRIVADEKRRRLFERFLNLNSKDDGIVQSIYGRYQDKIPFTEIQNAFLKDKYPEFQERMDLMREAERELTEENVRDMGDMMQHNLFGATPEQLQDYLEHMAIVRPDALRKVLEIKQQIKEENKGIVPVVGEIAMGLVADQASLWKGSGWAHLRA